jgi:hypothetical protein
MPKRHSAAELRRLNSVVVTVDELLAVNDSLFRAEAQGLPHAVVQAAIVHMRSEGHAVALVARYLALGDFVERNPDSPWLARERAGGEALPHLALFAAAACQPIVDRHGDFAFRRQPFLDRALAYAASRLAT